MHTKTICSLVTFLLSLGVMYSVCLAQPDCSMYEPLYGKWRFTTTYGYGHTITLDQFYCFVGGGVVCICGDSDGIFTYALGAYSVRVHYSYPTLNHLDIYNFTFLDAETVSGTFQAIIDATLGWEDDFVGVKIQDFSTTTTTTSITSTTSTSSIASSTTSTVSATTTSSIPITTTLINVTTTSTIIVTTSVNPATTTSIDNGCPPDYPVYCGDGSCCTLSHPVCGRGFYYDYCFEAGTNPNCPALTLYGEDSYEVEQLRFFRDNILSQTPEGQALIKLYYLWSPVIVKAMEEDEDFKKEVKEIIDEVLILIE